jgi:hypothetical protein
MGGRMLAPCVAAVGGIVAAASLGGCANSQEGEAQRVAASFYSAVESQDGAAACDALAPETKRELEQSSGKSCSQAILMERLPATGSIGSVRVFGTMAQVRYADETVFLSRFRSGWLVMAASCVPQAHDRYDCQVKGA